jgi:hypothetical protein
MVGAEAAIWKAMSSTERELPSPPPWVAIMSGMLRRTAAFKAKGLARQKIMSWSWSWGEEEVYIWRPASGAGAEREEDSAMTGQSLGAAEIIKVEGRAYA